MDHYLNLARAHAPLLIVIAPLIGAALALALPSARLSWLVASAAAVVTAALALDLAVRHLSGAPISIMRELIAVRVDGVGAFGAALVASAGALIVFGAGAGLKREFHPRAAPFALALMLCAMAGWIGALVADDLTAVFLAVETAWLASVGLVALSAERDRAALTGAVRMLFAGGVAAALFLFGIGLIDRSIGGADFGALARAHIAAPSLAAAGVGLVIFALALKAGVAPLHMWIGAAYGRAGGAAALMLGAVGAVGALAVLMRVSAFAIAAPAIGAGIAAALVALGVLSVVVGSVQAIGAVNLRRLAAYASAAQAGCIMVSVALGSPAGFAAASVQLFALCAAALALLGGSAAIGGDARLSALDGLGRRAPLAAAAITAGALSLMGAPLTTGFLGRWRLIEAGVGGGWWWATGAVIAASLAAVFYGGRLIERLYFRRVTTAQEQRRDLWRLALAPALLAAIAAIALGLEPSFLLRAADASAGVLTGGAP